MEKMSVLKPAQKKPNVSNPQNQDSAHPQSFLTRAETVSLTPKPEDTMEEEKDLLTTTSSKQGRKIAVPKPATESASERASSHPKGHKVHTLSEVWGSMDTKAFYRPTDTLTLMDVWFQPMQAEFDRGDVANVTMNQFVIGPHIKYRSKVVKMSCEDLLKCLYLGETIQWQLQGVPKASYDVWLNEKSAACVRAKGISESTNHAKLVNFILTEDHSYTFYPSCLKGLFGIFFRKICYHSYKDDGEKKEKIWNPTMIKCCGAKSFEYILEACIMPLPDNWLSDSSTDLGDLPESQLL